MKYVVNVVNGVLSRFYIFKGGRLQYGLTLKLTNQGQCGHAKESFDNLFCIQRFLVLLKKFLPSLNSQTDHHLLIIDGHG